jgi:hypothetical protein
LPFFDPPYLNIVSGTAFSFHSASRPFYLNRQRFSVFRAALASLDCCP